MTILARERERGSRAAGWVRSYRTYPRSKRCRIAGYGVPSRGVAEWRRSPGKGKEGSVVDERGSPPSGTPRAL